MLRKFNSFKYICLHSPISIQGKLLHGMFLIKSYKNNLNIIFIKALIIYYLRGILRLFDNLRHQTDKAVRISGKQLYDQCYQIHLQSYCRRRHTMKNISQVCVIRLLTQFLIISRSRRLHLLILIDQFNQHLHSRPIHAFHYVHRQHRRTHFVYVIKIYRKTSAGTIRSHLRVRQGMEAENVQR